MEEISIDMKSLGWIAYEAYCNFRNWRSFSGEALPPWTKLSVELREAWETAAEEVVEEYKHRQGEEEEL